MRNELKLVMYRALLIVLILAGSAYALDPLVQSTDLTYLGGFRIPQSSPYGYSGGAIGFNPAHTSLFILQDLTNTVAEISIPTPLNTAVGSMNIATQLQAGTDITGGNLGNIAAGGGAYGAPVVIGGFLDNSGTLISDVYGNYDAGNVAVLSHFTASEAFGSPNFHGMFQVGTLNPGFVAGGMTHIPGAWQSPLGGGGSAILTGQGGLNIITRTSSGPAAFLFEPNQLGVSNPVADIPLIYYPPAHPTLGDWSNQTVAGNLFNMGTQMGGMAFIVGSRSFLAFGRQGAGVPCYGIGDSNPANDHVVIGGEEHCYDPVYSAKGVHSYPYSPFVWAYDANDMQAAKNGAKNPWEVVPYAHWSFPDFGSPNTGVRSTAYDTATNKLYFSESGGDNNGISEPVIRVYQVNTSIPTPTPLPTATPVMQCFH